MYGPATTRCFNCHTTASFNSGKFEPAGLENGVTCEACHGPAANHVAAEKAGMDEAAGALLNPGKLNRANAVDFCGACHRTTGDVIEQGWVDIGVMNARFQPYRMQKSLCWERGDARLTCTSCHDPHKPLAKDAAAYDAACLRCHVSKGETANRRSPRPRLQGEPKQLRHLSHAEVRTAGSAFTIQRPLHSHREKWRNLSQLNPRLHIRINAEVAEPRPVSPTASRRSAHWFAPRLPES